MYATLQAKDAYGQSTATLRDDRQTEYDIIAKVTANLARYANAPSTEFAALAEAVHKNRRLWTILAADVSDPGNALPSATRAQIFYLYEFTINHSTKVLDGEATVEPLIEINRAMLRGISGQTGDA